MWRKRRSSRSHPPGHARPHGCYGGFCERACSGSIAASTRTAVSRRCWPDRAASPRRSPACPWSSAPCRRGRSTRSQYDRSGSRRVRRCRRCARICRRRGCGVRCRAPRRAIQASRPSRSRCRQPAVRVRCRSNLPYACPKRTSAVILPSSNDALPNWRLARVVTPVTSPQPLDIFQELVWLRRRHALSDIYIYEEPRMNRHSALLPSAQGHGAMRRMISARRLLRVAVPLIWLFLAVPVAWTQTTQEAAWCEGKDSATADQRIQGCTAAINSGRIQGKTLGLAYRLRAYAELYLKRNEMDEALRDYDAAIKLNPTDPSSYYGRADIYKVKAFQASGPQRKQYIDFAIRDFSENIRLSAKPNPLDYINRSNAYSLDGDNDRAAKDLGQALRLDPSDKKEALVNRCRIYADMGRWQEALADCN